MCFNIASFPGSIRQTSVLLVTTAAVEAGNEATLRACGRALLHSSEYGTLSYDWCKQLCSLVGLGVMKIPEDFNIDWKGTPDLYQNVVSWKSVKLTP